MSEFSRTYRLVSKHDFQSVFVKPNKKTHKCFLLLYQSNQKDYARLGVVISKNHVKLAVNRNQVRRLIRESFRYYKDKLKGLDIIVLLRSKCTPIDKKALRDDIDHLWPRLTPS